MDTIKICDSNFLPYSKSASLGKANADVFPTHVRWEQAAVNEARFVTDAHIKDAHGSGQVAWLLEPYLLHPENYELIGKRADDFDFVLMHSKYLELGIKNARFYPLGGARIAFDQFGMHRKTKMISLINSHKDSMPGHHLRNAVEKACFGAVDVFQDFPSKLDALAPYRYSIVIESERTDYYFTEKIVDCCAVGTVPIYWGAPSINRFFDECGILECTGIQDLLEAVERTSPQDYHDRLKAVAYNIQAARSWAICEDTIYEMYPEIFG